MRMSSAGAVLLQSRKLARKAASSGAHGGQGTGTGSPTRPGSILQQAGARSPGDSPDAVRDDTFLLLLLLLSILGPELRRVLDAVVPVPLRPVPVGCPAPPARPPHSSRACR